jgi:YD repeat-containing protein
MVYKGFHESLVADTNDTEWRIWKYTYDASDNPVLIEGPDIGSWDNRENLGWV